MSSESTPSGKAAPEVRKAQRWNIVWVVPVVALLIGSWLIYENFMTSGPTAKIFFETAEEIHAGKTEVRCRSVKVGMVKEVRLTDSRDSVVVMIEMDSGSENLLCEGSRFWVVKPRLSAAGISGLGTLIQGSYIELDPGPKDARRIRDFIGLEKPPATNSSVPGLRIQLTAWEAGILQIGAPIYYRGFEVGRIEDRKLSENGSEVIYDAFIARDYCHLVRENTRFWDSSGIQVEAGSQGIMLQTPSVEAILSGGVSFGLMDGVQAGGECQDGQVFELFADKESARYSSLKPDFELLLLFDQSVRGLSARSAVEFRGIPIGRISRISFDLVNSSENSLIPVLVRIDPSRLINAKAEQEGFSVVEFLQAEIDKGLRAGIKTTSLLTSAVHIDFDYYPAAPKEKLGLVNSHTTFPTIKGGFSHIETQLSSLIRKLESMPVESSLKDISQAAKEGKAMAKSMRKLLNDPAFDGLPAELKATLASIGPNGEIQGDIKKTLDELQATLRSLKAVADLLEEKPNAVIFGRDKDKKDKDEDNKSDRPSNLGPRHR